MLQAQEETARLDEEVSISKEKLGDTEAQLRNAQAEIMRQLEKNGELKSRMFCIDNLSGDESISFYTGFPNLQTFQATLVYLPPFSLIRDFRNQTTRGNISKISVNHT